jgi:peptidase E
METDVKPIFLLADSQVLFYRGNSGDQNREEPFMERIRRLIETTNPEGPFKAAYIGASNDDTPEYYDIFTAAMSQVGISRDQCRMIPSQTTTEEDLQFLEQADLVLLAGGDVEKGWNVIKEKFQKIVLDRYYNGAVLIGISAGAVQLGLRGWTEDQPLQDHLFETFQLVPAVISAHDEENDWDGLRTIVEHMGAFTRGFGIPTGGAAAYHPDWTFEAIRHPLVEFAHVKDDGEEIEFKRSMILPSQNKDVEVLE